MDQADELARYLELGPRRILLDIGNGSGWPGDYFVGSPGFSAVLTDPTFGGDGPEWL